MLQFTLPGLFLATRQDSQAGAEAAAEVVLPDLASSFAECLDATEAPLQHAIDQILTAQSSTARGKILPLGPQVDALPKPVPDGRSLAPTFAQEFETPKHNETEGDGLPDAAGHGLMAAAEAARVDLSQLPYAMPSPALPNQIALGPSISRGLGLADDQTEGDEDLVTLGATKRPVAAVAGTLPAQESVDPGKRSLPLGVLKTEAPWPVLVAPAPGVGAGPDGLQVTAPTGAMSEPVMFAGAVRVPPEGRQPPAKPEHLQGQQDRPVNGAQRAKFDPANPKPWVTKADPSLLIPTRPTKGAVDPTSERQSGHTFLPVRINASPESVFAHVLPKVAQDPPRAQDAHIAAAPVAWPAPPFRPEIAPGNTFGMGQARWPQGETFAVRLALDRANPTKAEPSSNQRTQPPLGRQEPVSLTPVAWQPSPMPQVPQVPSGAEAAETGKLTVAMAADKAKVTAPTIPLGGPKVVPPHQNRHDTTALTIPAPRPAADRAMPHSTEISVGPYDTFQGSSGSLGGAPLGAVPTIPAMTTSLTPRRESGPNTTDDKGAEADQTLTSGNLSRAMSPATDRPKAPAHGLMAPEALTVPKVMPSQARPLLNRPDGVGNLPPARNAPLTQTTGHRPGAWPLPAQDELSTRFRILPPTALDNRRAPLAPVDARPAVPDLPAMPRHPLAPVAGPASPEIPFSLTPEFGPNQDGSPLPRHSRAILPQAEVRTEPADAEPQNLDISSDKDGPLLDGSDKPDRAALPQSVVTSAPGQSLSPSLLDRPLRSVRPSAEVAATKDVQQSLSAPAPTANLTAPAPQVPIWTRPTSEPARPQARTIPDGTIPSWPDPAPKSDRAAPPRHADLPAALRPFEGDSTMPKPPEAEGLASSLTPPYVATDGRSDRTSAPATPGQPFSAAPPVPHSLPGKLGADLVKGAKEASREDRLELMLDPIELGRVRFEITQDGERLQVFISVERAETLDLLRRNVDHLRAEFRDAGFDSSNLSFGNWDGGQDQRPEPGPQPTELERLGPVSAAADSLPTPPAPRRIAAQGELHLRL